jgi:hypothetical protein
MAAQKTKSMTGKDGGRKLATGAGRKTHKSGGEPQKQTINLGASRRRTGSSKQRKG